MTLILGTPIVPYKIVDLIQQVVIPKDTPPVRSITLRNKQEGKINGNWGYFYPDEYKITLCIPTEVKDYLTIRKYTKRDVYIENKLEFVACVLGHELYHAWQWNNHRDLWHCKEWLEVGAELYESEALDKWKVYLKENMIYEKVARNNNP